MLPLRTALDLCGLSSESGVRERARVASADCFASVGATDLVGSGAKIAGCAMAATRSAVLLQASIPARELSRSLPLDDETVLRYTNPIWNATAFRCAIGSGAVASGWSPRLVTLDPALDLAERVRATFFYLVDWTALPCRGISWFDGLDADFARASSSEERRAILENRRDPQDWKLDSDEILRRIEGF